MIRRPYDSGAYLGSGNLHQYLELPKNYAKVSEGDRKYVVLTSPPKRGDMVRIRELDCPGGVTTGRSILAQVTDSEPSEILGGHIASIQILPETKTQY